MKEERIAVNANPTEVGGWLSREVFSLTDSVDKISPEFRWDCPSAQYSLSAVGEEGALTANGTLAAGGLHIEDATVQPIDKLE